jgi:hypothetical protein
MARRSACSKAGTSERPWVDIYYSSARHAIDGEQQALLVKESQPLAMIWRRYSSGAQNHNESS